MPCFELGEDPIDWDDCEVETRGSGSSVMGSGKGKNHGNDLMICAGVWT
jgi:hypothetical protein